MITTGDIIMSNNELLIAKGRLAEQEELSRQLEMKAESILIQLREILNPYSKFLNLELERALLLIKEFRELQLKARDSDNMIKQIKQNYNL